MKREIHLPGDGCVHQWWGYAGEREHSVIIVTLPPDVADCDYCQAEVSIKGKKYRTDNLEIIGGAVSFELTSAMTAESGQISAQIVGYVVCDDGDIEIAKTDVYKSRIKPSVNGVTAEGKDELPLWQRCWAAVQDIIKKAHTHRNLKTLEKLYCELAELESGDGFTIAPDYEGVDRLKFANKYLRYCVDGSVITNKEEVKDEDGNVIAFRIYLSGRGLGTAEECFDIPVTGITKSQVQLAPDVTINSSQLNLGVGEGSDNEILDTIVNNNGAIEIDGITLLSKDDGYLIQDGKFTKINGVPYYTLYFADGVLGIYAPQRIPYTDPDGKKGFIIGRELNATTLDKLTEDENGTLLFDGEEIGSGIKSVSALPATANEGDIVYYCPPPNTLTSADIGKTIHLNLAEFDRLKADVIANPGMEHWAYIYLYGSRGGPCIGVGAYTTQDVTYVCFYYTLDRNGNEISFEWVLDNDSNSFSVNAEECYIMKNDEITYITEPFDRFTMEDMDDAEYKLADECDTDHPWGTYSLFYTKPRFYRYTNGAWVEVLTPEAEFDTSEIWQAIDEINGGITEIETLIDESGVLE